MRVRARYEGSFIYKATEYFLDYYSLVSPKIITSAHIKISRVYISLREILGNDHYYVVIRDILLCAGESILRAYAREKIPESFDSRFRVDLSGTASLRYAALRVSLRSIPDASYPKSDRNFLPVFFFQVTFQCRNQPRKDFYQSSPIFQAFSEHCSLCSPLRRV